MYFCSKQCPINFLYSDVKILELKDMFVMVYVKCIIKFNNHRPMLSGFFNHYFTKFDSVHKTNTKQKQCNEFFQFHIKLSLNQEKLYIPSA